MTNRSTLQKILDSIRSQKVLVVGDLMLDRYLLGTYKRLNPEAPVPLVDIKHESDRLGGAANVAVNLASLGLKPYLVGMINDQDFEGQLFIEKMGKQGLSTEGIIFTDKRITTSKVRIYAQNHYLLRFDKEVTHPLSADEQCNVLNKINQLLKKNTFQSIIIEDYDKGMLNSEIIQTIIHQSEKYNIPVMVDPKFQNFWSYKEVFLLKPNLKELNQALNMNVDGNNIEDVIEAAKQLRIKMPHRNTLITLAENGMLLIHEDDLPIHITGKPRIVKDVSGAGDTVISTFTALSLAGTSTKEAAKIANIAGGIVCEQVGIVPITPQDLLNEIE